MTETVRPEDLRTAIMQEIRVKSSGSTLPGICERLGLDHPEGRVGLGADSKGTYIRDCMSQLRTHPEMIDLAKRVVEQLGSDRLEQLLATLGPRGAKGEFRNLIFGGLGAKADMVLSDALNNDVMLTNNKDVWLIYDEPLSGAGLTWWDMVKWWQKTYPGKVAGLDGRSVFEQMRARFRASLSEDSPPERSFFDAYCQRYDRPEHPALIPQVCVHYDPYTRRERGGNGPLARERMDFLLLLPGRVRVVLEIDGVQHYSDEKEIGGAKVLVANRDKYAEMVAADRRLRLAGYEVYRFGGKELWRNASGVVDPFMAQLFANGTSSGG
ncbi:hypothetical protein [Streptomyces erythrochromogenes]|uniref:hypothetical protein n=1 Tax=Streptomyces erythrochromogenes TaxID=285574 RepID=UPI0036D17B99